MPTGVSVPRVSDEVAATGAADLAVFGLRVSRLPRFCPLAMLFLSVCCIWKLCCAETRSSTILGFIKTILIISVQFLRMIFVIEYRILKKLDVKFQ